LASQRRLQSRKDWQTLFAQTGQVASDASEGDGSLVTAKGSGNFLLNFHHPNIPFGKIVVKRNIQALQEEQDCLLVLAQAIQQIAGRVLFGFASFARRRWSTGMNLIALMQQREKLRLQSLYFLCQEAGLAKGAGLIRRFLHRGQQDDHFVSPPEAQLLRKEGQLAQDMHATQAMLASVEEIGAPGIMNAGPDEAGQDADLIQRVVSSTDMRLIMGQGGSGGHMHPDALSLHIQSSFILMDDLCLAERGFDLLLNRHQKVSGVLDQPAERALTHSDAEQIREHFSGSTSWQQLLGGQIYCHGSNPRSVLHGRSDALGKGGTRVALTVRALFPFPFVLRDVQSRRRRDVDHLPPFDGFDGDLRQVGLTVLAVSDCWQGDRLRRLRAHLQRVPLMPSLSTWLLPTLLAQTPRFALPRKAVRGRRQRAILAVFGHLLLQSFDLFGQLLDLLLQQAILLSKLDQFFFRCHAFTLPDAMRFGKS
jgi:hypothetical protein